MQEGEKVDVTKIEKVDKETQPPKRFNQSSIIKELEKRNLGTKATRADILDRLFQRGYIDGVKITVTELGMETVGILEKHAPTIVDEALTAEFEMDMEKIREGKEKEENVLEKAKKTLTKLLTAFKKKEKEIGKDILKSVKETWDKANYMGSCPKCKEGKLTVKRGKFGRFVGCDKYPDCKTILNIPKKGVVKYLEKECEHDKYPIVQTGSGRSTRKGCLNPDCKSKTIDADGNEIVKKEGYKEEGMTCPTCNEGQMVLRKSFYGSFLGCNGYPKCQTMMKIKKGVVDVENPVVKDAKKSKDVKKEK